MTGGGDREKRYSEELRAEGYRKTECYGISFSGRTAKSGSERKLTDNDIRKLKLQHFPKFIQ